MIREKVVRSLPQELLMYRVVSSKEGMTKYYHTCLSLRNAGKIRNPETVLPAGSLISVALRQGRFPILNPQNTINTGLLVLIIAPLGA